MRDVRSPDKKWTAFAKDNNVYLRDADGKETPLSDNGKAGNAYGMFVWSPDSKALVSARIEPGDNKEVYLLESSPKDGGRALQAFFAEVTAYAKERGADATMTPYVKPLSQSLSCHVASAPP